MKKGMISLAMAMTMLFTFSTMANAEEAIETAAAYNCSCSHQQWTWECMNNPIEIGSTTHSYGLFWSETCSTTVKGSTVRNFCYRCKGNIPERDTNERHDCKQIHWNCGKGTVNICTIIGQYSLNGELQ